MFLVALGLHCSAMALSSCSKQGLLSSCSAQASQWLHLLQNTGSRCVGLSGGEPQALHHSLSSCGGPQASLPAACIIFPDQGLNSRPLHWQVDT